MKRAIKYIIFYSVCALVGAGIGILIGETSNYIIENRPIEINEQHNLVASRIVSSTQWNIPYVGKILSLDSDLTKYRCESLVAVVGNDLKFCRALKPRENPENLPMVMGEFTASPTMIRVDTNADMWVTIHEFTHYAIDCTRQLKTEESCVQSAQKMMVDLSKIK